MYTKNDPIRKLNRKEWSAHWQLIGEPVGETWCRQPVFSYKNGSASWADMIEVDAAMTTDGVFYAFHNGEEKIEYGIQKDIRTMSSQEVDSLYALNSLGQRTKQKAERLEEVLERFRGQCLINIRRSWFYWKEIIAFLNSKGMQDQILLKSGVEESC